MNDIIFHAGTVSVYVSLWHLHDITKDVRGSVDYLCQIDTDGHQTWQTNTGEDPIASIIKKNHSEKLEKISQDITLWLTLSIREQNKKEKQETAQNRPWNKIVCISDRVPTREELEEIGKRRERTDIGIINRRNEENARKDALNVMREWGVLGLRRLI